MGFFFYCGILFLANLKIRQDVVAGLCLFENLVPSVSFKVSFSQIIEVNELGKGHPSHPVYSPAKGTFPTVSLTGSRDPRLDIFSNGAFFFFPKETLQAPLYGSEYSRLCGILPTNPHLQLLEGHGKEKTLSREYFQSQGGKERKT